MVARRAIVAAALLVALVPVSANAACAPPTTVDVAVPVPAGLVVPQATVRVLLPGGYASSTTHYPVLYLLHGVGDSFQTWTANTDVEGAVACLGLIVVMPDGGRGAEAGWYSDWAYGTPDWETFHTDVLIDHIDATFRTTGKRAIAGASMGGFGAMSYAARHPGMFEAAASFSGYLDTMHMAPGSGTFYHHAGQGLFGQSLGTPNRAVWGDQVDDEVIWRAHNPTDLADDLDDVWLYVATGTGTPGGEHEQPSAPHAYLTEQFIWQVNRNFIAALDREDAVYHAYPGQHTWPYWERELVSALPGLSAAID